MTIIRNLALIVLLAVMLPNSVEANPATPMAASLAWSSLRVETTEGVDVWLKIDVVGAQPNENVNLQYTYTTVENTATSENDYVPAIGVAGAITGQKRTALIKIDIKRNQVYEPYEQFYVRLNPNSSNTIISGAPRLTVGIYRSQIFYSLLVNWQSCEFLLEPANDFASTAGVLLINNIWCYGNFNGEAPNQHDYYLLKPTQNGTVTLTLVNTTINQHNLQLYLYKHNGGDSYVNIAQSINPDQLDESIVVQVSANTTYLISVFWANSTDSTIPTYTLKAEME